MAIFIVFSTLIFKALSIGRKSVTHTYNTSVLENSPQLAEAKQLKRNLFWRGDRRKTLTMQLLMQIFSGFIRNKHRGKEKRRKNRKHFLSIDSRDFRNSRNRAANFPLFHSCQHRMRCESFLLAPIKFHLDLFTLSRIGINPILHNNSFFAEYIIAWWISFRSQF